MVRAGGSEEDKQGVFVQVTLFISASWGGTKCTALKEVSPRTYGSGSSTLWLAPAQALFAGWQPGVRRAAAVLSTGFGELWALQAVLRWAGWLFRAGGKGVLLWHPQPCGRLQQWGGPRAPLALNRPPKQLIQNPDLLLQHLAAEWLTDQSWHYLLLILYLLSSEYFGWVITQCVLCTAEPRNICFGFSSWLVRVCGFWPRSHGIVSDYVNENFIQENNEYRPENKAHPVAISQRQFFLLKPIRGSAVAIIYTCT